MPADTPSLRRGLLRRRLLPLGGALLAAYFTVGLFVAVSTTKPVRHFNAAISPATQGLGFEDVSFPSRGGDATIAAWFVPPPAGAPPRRAVVLVHGKDSSRTSNFWGHSPEIAASLNQRGLAVLVIDLRGHGKSSDAHLTLGLKEAKDVLGAVDWLRGRGFPAGAIGVHGSSMGAAASIFAAADEPAIGAVVTDCGFADIRPVLAAQWRYITGLPPVFVPATRLASWLFLGADIGMSQPVTVIGKLAPRPVLLIHGDADQLIPPSQALALKTALPSAELWMIPGAHHVGGYKLVPAEYTRRVTDFFDQHLPR